MKAAYNNRNCLSTCHYSSQHAPCGKKWIYNFKCLSRKVVYVQHCSAIIQVKPADVLTAGLHGGFITSVLTVFVIITHVTLSYALPICTLELTIPAGFSTPVACQHYYIIHTISF